MKDDVIKRKEIYEGTVCEIVKTPVQFNLIAAHDDVLTRSGKKTFEKSLVNKCDFDHVIVNFVRDSVFVKINDNLYYDFLEHEFLSLLPSCKVAKEQDEGYYLLSPHYIGNCKPSFSFKEEDGNLVVYGDKGVSRRRVNNNGRR